jgi:hypothetical protein
MLTFVRNNGQEAVQSRISLTAPHTLVSQYARGMFASYLYQSHPRRVLIVGPGGGAMVRFLTYHEPQMYIDAVEIDPAVVRLADQYFGVRSHGNVRVHTSDAVTFVESTSDRYDLILMDAFLRPSREIDTTGVPTRLKTVAFLGRLKRTLATGGVVACNINKHASIADDVAAVAAVFGHVAVYRCPPAENRSSSPPRAACPWRTKCAPGSVRSTRASVGRCHSPMSRGTGNSVDFGSNPVTWPVRQHCSCSGPSCSARGRSDTTCRTVPLSGFVGAVGVTDEDLKAFLDMVSRRLPSPAGNREICLEPATKRWIDGSLRA